MFRLDFPELVHKMPVEVFTSVPADDYLILSWVVPHYPRETVESTSGLAPKLGKTTDNYDLSGVGRAGPTVELEDVELYVLHPLFRYKIFLVTGVPFCSLQKLQEIFLVILANLLHEGHLKRRGRPQLEQEFLISTK